MDTLNQNPLNRVCYIHAIKIRIGFCRTSAHSVSINCSLHPNCLPLLLKETAPFYLENKNLYDKGLMIDR